MKSYFKNLFSQLESEDFSYSNPIKRGEKFADEMCHSYPEIQNFIMHLQDEWEQAKINEEDISTYVIDRKDSAGMVIKTSDTDKLGQLHYLIDYIRDVLKQDDYIVHVNKHLCERKGGVTQESWKYFLKPKPTFDEYGKYTQRYGTVMIELKKDAKAHLQFKLQCNYYAGFNYREPISFQDLLANL
jgi:hypothetical protein